MTPTTATDHATRAARYGYEHGNPTAPCGLETIAGGAIVHTSSLRDAHRVAYRVLSELAILDADASVTVEPYVRHAGDPDLHTTHRVVVRQPKAPPPIPPSVFVSR